ncbi:MAG: hypothetical protein AAFY67_13065 [Cyanobacteria bacterium J06642_9]
MIRYLWCVLPILAISLPGTVARADDPASVPSPCWMIDQTGQIVDLEEFCIDSEPPESSTNAEAEATEEDPEVIILIDGSNRGTIPQVPSGASPETTPDAEGADPEEADPEEADPEETDPEAVDPTTPETPTVPGATPPETPTVPEATPPETPTVPEATPSGIPTDGDTPDAVEPNDSGDSEPEEAPDDTGETSEAE